MIRTATQLKAKVAYAKKFQIEPVMRTYTEVML